MIPVANFAQDFLTNYPNPNDFYQDISENLTNAIINNAETLGLAGTLDSVSVKLRRSPTSILPHPFFSQSTAIPTELLNNPLQGRAFELLPESFIHDI